MRQGDGLRIEGTQGERDNMGWVKILQVKKTRSTLALLRLIAIPIIINIEKIDIL